MTSARTASLSVSGRPLPEGQFTGTLSAGLARPTSCQYNSVRYRTERPKALAGCGALTARIVPAAKCSVQATPHQPIISRVSCVKVSGMSHGISLTVPKAPNNMLKMAGESKANSGYRYDNPHSLYRIW